MLRKCSKCGLPETYETIEFDGEGECNICRQKEYRDAEIDWDNRKKMLDELIQQYRGKYDYDCIPALSLEEKKAYLYWNQYHFKKKLYDDVFKITVKKTDSDGTVKNSNETYKFNNAYQNLRHDFENSIKKFGTLEYLFEALATMFLLVDLSTSKIFAKAEIDNSGNLTGWVSSGTAIRKTFDTK